MIPHRVLRNTSTLPMLMKTATPLHSDEAFFLFLHSLFLGAGINAIDDNLIPKARRIAIERPGRRSGPSGGGTIGYGKYRSSVDDVMSMN